LAHKVSGTLLGIWLLIPEHLRLGTWDLLSSWCSLDNNDIEKRLSLQLINEAALCLNGIRRSRSLCHQSFEIANGLPYIATDKEIHNILDSHTIADSKQLQVRLAVLRKTLGHYKGSLWAFDPHRIPTYSKRIMVKKKSCPKKHSKKILQTFFSVDAETGQPFGFTLGSSGKTTTRASIELLQMMSLSFPSEKGLLVADTEHESRELLDYIIETNAYEIIMPASRREKIMNIIKKLDYKPHWCGYATAETIYRHKKGRHNFRLIGQRTGETESDFSYKPFIASGSKLSIELLSEDFPKRWSIEEFFNFDGAIGWNRASTMNLNIRYAKMSLALIAQAVTYQFKRKLPQPYKRWNEQHLANSILRGIDGDLRVKNDTIIVTLYNVPKELNLEQHYENLPQKLEAEGVNPKIPWLFNLKLDFKFK
jgi:hypothetical protein